ncbi:unnamed protein product [Rotaria sordida]|uniref:Transposase n=1 Tax=Rotaria sordida TaxID=392033 RepID=A0A814UAV9_9BILA|nr:unnamed protein product [Rotaria sordida]CAF3923919.1 unnamed protein product [Rotaria sordida]
MAKFQSRITVRRYLQRENFAYVPLVLTIKRIYNKFLETCSVKHHDNPGRPAVATTEKINEITEILATTPINSVRLVSQQVNLSKSVIHRTMKNILKYKPYKMHLIQQLYDEDQDLRVELCELLMPILEHNDNDGLIFFSDEASFHVLRLVNKHICRIWSEKNPFVTIDIATNSSKVSVWCAMSSKQIIEPFFFNDETVTEGNYLEMLQNYFYPILQNKRLTKSITFQQNGAPAHFSKAVRSWLNKVFDGRWIGRCGLISWTPRSSDLTSLNFYLWGHLKTNVYKTPVQALDDLKTRITKEIKIIKKETLRDVFSEIVKRLNFCIEVKGSTFEQYL